MRKLTLCLVACVTYAAACSSNESSPPAPSEMPVESASFFDHFHSSRYSKSAEAAAALDVAAKANPNAGRLSFDRALAHLWHVNEFRRDPNPDPRAIQAEVESLVPLFETAKRNNPDDQRVGCFVGTTLVGAGQAAKNDEMVRQGFAVLDEAVQAWPEFNLFCKALAYDGSPASNPDYAKAVDAVYETLDACFDERIDRDRPDITKYLDRATDQGRKRVCWNDWIAPHNAEGFYLYMGDLLVKQAKVSAARVAYQNVKLIREYPSWPYKSLLDERLGADLDAKAALYQDTDPKNDPPIGGASANRACAYCHAATAVE